MGNRQSRSKSISDAPSVKKRKKGGQKGGGVGNSGKHQSMPELGGSGGGTSGAVPYRDGDVSVPNIKVTMYRSYSELGRSKSSVGREDEKVDYKFYRRSAANFSDKPRTLPKNFGRSKSTAAGYPGVRAAFTPNGSVDRGFPGLDPAKRVSRASSMNSAISAISPADFPDTAQIKHKLAKYEEYYIEILAKKFRDLPPGVQCERLVIARDTGVKNRRVSLGEYMTHDTPVPCDLLTAENQERYRLCIPESLFCGIRHVKSENRSHDVDLVASLARDVVTCIATEAANELTRIYEYQIILMYDDTSIRLLADHATECVLEYLHGHYIDRNSAIRSVIQVYPPNTDGMPKLISGVIGSKELKWDLYEVYKQPGLRKELLLVSDEWITPSGIDYQPWQYYYSKENSSPFLYGYRGQMIDWDFLDSLYVLDMKENVKFTEEIAQQVEDYHRLYMPYKRLVGAQVMDKYIRQSAVSDKKLTDMIRVDPLEGPPERDEITAVYRPIKTQSGPIKYGGDHVINLDNIDLTRAHMAETDLSNVTVQNSKLLLANMDNTKLDNAKLAGSDLSYCNMESSDISPHALKDVTVNHVMFNESFSAPTSPTSPTGGPTSPTGAPTSPTSPTGADQADGEESGLPGRTSIVSDRQGNVMLLSNAIDLQKARVEEENKSRQEEADRVRIQKESSPVVSNAVKPGDSRKKRKKKKKRIEELAGGLNQSVDSTGQASVTDNNFLDLSKDSGIVRPAHPTSTPRPQSTPQPQSTPRPQPTLQPQSNPHTNGHINDEQVNSFFTSSEATPTGQPQTVTPPSDRPPGQSVTPPGGQVLRPSHVQNNQMIAVSSPVVLSQTLPSHHSNPSNQGAAEEIIHSESEKPLESQGSRGVKTNIKKESRPIDSRYSNVEIRPHRIQPRIVKAHSLHGRLSTAGNGLSDADAQNNNLTPQDKHASTGDVQHFRRSQIFRMLAGLHIARLEPRVPDLGQPFIGRDDEVADIVELLSSSGRLIILTGCPGVGKSSLARAVSHEMITRHVTPVFIDALTCTSLQSVIQATMDVFRLKFRQHELQYFYNWINSHQQRLLFVYDNMEPDESMDDSISGFLDGLLYNINHLSILTTSHRQYFRGETARETYRVGDVREHSQEILYSMIPDCHQQGVTDLASSVDHILYGLHLCGKAFSLPDVDSGKLFEDLTSNKCSLISTNRLELAITKYTSDEMERQRLYKLALVIGGVINNMDTRSHDLLAVCQVITSSFTADVFEDSCSLESSVVMETLQQLVSVGLLVQCQEGRYFMPRFVRVAVSVCWPDDGSRMVAISQYYVKLLSSLCTEYHSSQAHTALSGVHREYDNIVHTLSWLLEREDLYERCQTFADVEYAIFLTEVLPQGLYDDLYENLNREASDNNDVVTSTNAICCCAYRCLSDRRNSSARAYAENAYEALSAAQVQEIDKAFCMQCLGRSYWEDDRLKDKALTLVKCSVDIYKSSYSLKHIKALYANEEYAKLLTERDSHQRARHVFNVSDLVLCDILDSHPALISGYDCRRVIWEKLCLFTRSTEIAQKAADTAERYYGDHPITANALTSLGHCIVKRGSLQDCIQIAVHALHIRIQVLGDHADTGASYQMLAYLMQRSGHHDEALRFAMNGLEVYEKVDMPERKQIEVKNIIAQARYRLENRASIYVEIDSKSGAKNRVADKNNKVTANHNMALTSASTEV